MNPKLLFLCAALALRRTPISLQAGTWTLNTLPSGLVAWWPADGTAADVSPNHLDGALSGGAGYTNGWAGSAFAFDGANGCATVPDSPALWFTNALTIEFWARRQRWDIDIVLEKGGDWDTAVGGEANFGVGLHTVNNRMFYFFFRGGWRGTSGVNDFNWHHYAIVATNGAANPALYIDGVARPVEFAEGAAVLNLYPSTRPLHIGAQVFSGWNYYGNNVLDDVRLYSRGLRADEIALLHAGPPPDGLLSWWQGEGDTADALGQHHGTPQGGLGYTAGQLGQGFALDGTSGAVALGNWFNLQQFTLSLWVKLAPTQVQFADLLDNNHTSSRSWVFERVNSPDPADWLWHAGPDAELFFQLATNRWQHLVVSRDTNGVSRLYLEGRPAGSVTNGGPIDYDGTQFLWLGRWGAGGRYFNGLVDELMVFDRPLSADEVAWLHASQGGRPRLDIQPGPGTVQLSWPLGAAAYRLEAATDLQSGNWTTVTNVVVSSPTRFNLSLPPDDQTTRHDSFVCTNRETLVANPRPKTTYNMRTTRTLLTALALTLPLAGAMAQPFVTNRTTSIYAVVPDPLALSFGADGALYVGRDASGSGGSSGAAVKIHRVAPGGAPVTEFGDTAISDPDALIVDLAGAVSGTPGAVLVGGVHNDGSTGKIVKIAPDGTVTTLFAPSATWWNPSDFAFDQPGRLLFTEINNGRVLATTGGAPTVLFTLASAHHLAVDALGRIAVSTSSGTQLRLYTSDGALSNANFAAVKASSPVVRGPGGEWGTDLYAIAPNGNLIRIGLDGATNVLGGRFLMTSGAVVPGLAFGPDGALYASDFEADRIYRFGQPEVPGAQTTAYARVTDPVRLAFAPDGTLFVGRDNTGSGGDYDDAVKIHRVGPGGSPVQEFGNAAISDPDAVVYDASGSASGIPGAVIVAGHELNSLAGKIVAIRPDQSLTTLYSTTATFNPNVFAYDLNGRLLFSDNEGGKVWVLTNGVPTVLFNLAGALHLAADELNRLVVGVEGSSTLRLYTGGGVLLTNAFASVGVNSPLARGPGGFWGTGIFCVNPNGDLLSLDLNGAATKWGMGFGAPYGMAFGPDGALYVSEFDSDLIWRVAPGEAAPSLRIWRTATNTIVISWSWPAEGWVLEATNALPGVAAPWPQILPPYQTNGPNLQFTEPTPTGNKFYRLHKQ